MYCPNCGSEVDNSASFCFNCGTKLNNLNNAPQQTQPPLVQQVDSSQVSEPQVFEPQVSEPQASKPDVITAPMPNFNIEPQAYEPAKTATQNPVYNTEPQPFQANEPASQNYVSSELKQEPEALEPTNIPPLAQESAVTSENTSQPQAVKPTKPKFNFNSAMHRFDKVFNVTSESLMLAVSVISIIAFCFIGLVSSTRSYLVPDPVKTNYLNTFQILAPIEMLSAQNNGIMEYLSIIILFATYFVCFIFLLIGLINSIVAFLNLRKNVKTDKLSKWSAVSFTAYLIPIMVLKLIYHYEYYDGMYDNYTEFNIITKIAIFALIFFFTLAIILKIITKIDFNKLKKPINIVSLLISILSIVTTILFFCFITNPTFKFVQNTFFTEQGIFPLIKLPQIFNGDVQVVMTFMFYAIASLIPPIFLAQNIKSKVYSLYHDKQYYIKSSLILAVFAIFYAVMGIAMAGILKDSLVPFVTSSGNAVGIIVITVIEVILVIIKIVLMMLEKQKPEEADCN